MSQVPEAYEVECPQVSIICGVYLQEGKNYYKQVGGKHSLVVCDDNCWGIFHDRICVCYALEKTLFPSGVKAWEYLHGKSYRSAPKMRVRAKSLGSTQPTTSRSNPCYVEKASDWECIQEYQGMWKPKLVYYKNKVTNMKQRDVPAIIARQSLPTAGVAKSSSPQVTVQSPQVNTKQQQLQQHSAVSPNVQGGVAHATTEPTYTFCSYERELCGGPTKLYAPVSYATAKKHKIIKKVTAGEWDVCEEFWMHTASEMELMIESVQGELSEITYKHRIFHEELEPLRQQVAALQARQQALSADESRAVERSNTMQLRHGAGHVKRNEPARAGNAFPNGEQFVESLRTDFAPFEDFAMTVVDMLIERGEKYPINVFIENHMRPLFHATKQFVQHKIAEKQSGLKRLFGASVHVVDTDEEEQEDDENAEMSLPKQFFLLAQQPRILAELAALSDSEVLSMLGEARKIHAQWDQLRADFSFLTLARLLLRVHAVAALSDARFYLYPEIGSRVAYHDATHAEILSPGAKKFGSIKSKEPVEVVLSGIYFDPPQARPAYPSGAGSTSSTSVSAHAVESIPAFPAMVCRQVGRECQPPANQPPLAGATSGKHNDKKSYAIGNR